MASQRAPAWQKLLEEQHEFVRSIVRHLAGPELDAEDLAQDVFVIAHEKLGGLRDPSRARAWLYGICRRVVAAQRRRRRLRAALLHLWGSPETTAPDSPELASASRETERLLYEALGRLQPQKREAIILFALEGLDGAEIAELTGVPLGTVWTRLHAARKELLLEMKRQGMGDFAPGITEDGTSRATRLA